MAINRANKKVASTRGRDVIKDNGRLSVTSGGSKVKFHRHADYIGRVDLYLISSLEIDLILIFDWDGFCFCFLGLATRDFVCEVTNYYLVLSNKYYSFNLPVGT